MGGQKHVTSACLNCRRRKVKCDGQEICSNCSVSKLTCEYNAQADMRKVSAKKVITSLKARLAQLEDILREHNIEQPPPCDDETTQPASTSEGTSTARPDIKRSNTTTGRNLSDDDETSLAINPAPDPVEAYHRMGAAAAHESYATSGNAEYDTSGGHFKHPSQQHQQQQQNFILPPTPSRPSPQFDDPDEPSPGSQNLPEEQEVDGDIANLLAARMGSLRIAEDGQLRYYGPTSNLHVHYNGSQSLSRSMIRHVATEGLGVLRRLGLDQVVPLEIEMHLAKLYFAWEDPAIHVVHEETFFREKQKWAHDDRTSPYYSETLNNAICAIGASLASGEDLGIQEPASEFFSARAKALLDIEMDSPTVATVQALVIMSASEACFTRDARGWLYSGMAARLSADLGLHLDVTKHKNAGLLTQTDMDIRRTTFWGVFIHENMWSLYLGRPSGIGIRNITVQRPSNYFDEIEDKMWKPYPRPRGHSLIPEEGIPFDLNACTDANIFLCDFMRRINTTLYSGKTITIDEMAGFLVKTRKELFAWLDNIPSSLKIDVTATSTNRLYVPAILQLHMQFYATLISLYRPYLSSVLLRRKDDVTSPQDRQALLQAPIECVSAAHQIAETLRCYQRQHSLRRSNIQIVHITFTASLVFIYDVCTRTYVESRESLNDLQFCCHSLGEIGRCYGNSTRALEVIILVKSEWQRMASIQQARATQLKRRPSVVNPSPSIGSTNSHYDSTTMSAPDQDRSNKRRSRPSMSGRSDSLDPPVFLMPQSFSSYQVACDDFIGQTNTWAMQTVGEGIFDALQMPHVVAADYGTGTSMGDMMAPTIDWFDPHPPPDGLVFTAGLGSAEGTSGMSVEESIKVNANSPGDEISPIHEAMQPAG